MTLAIALGMLLFLAGPLCGALSNSLQEATAPQTRQEQQPDTKPRDQAPEKRKPQEKEKEGVPPLFGEQAVPEPQPGSGEPVVPAGPVDEPSEPSPADRIPEKPSSGPESAQKKRSRRLRPRKVVVRDGGTSEPTSQLAPGLPAEQATHSRQTTGQLLASAEANLKQASLRSLNPSQKAVLEQVRTFIEQANAALKTGDFQRGHNLAMKAHLLSDDLVRH